MKVCVCMAKEAIQHVCKALAPSGVGPQSSSMYSQMINKVNSFPKPKLCNLIDKKKIRLKHTNV